MALGVTNIANALSSICLAFVIVVESGGGEMYKFAEQNFKLRVLPDENYNTN